MTTWCANHTKISSNVTVPLSSTQHLNTFEHILLVCQLLSTTFLWFYYTFLKCSLRWCTCDLLLPNPGHRPTSVIESHTPRKNAAAYMHFTLSFEDLMCLGDILWLLTIIAVHRQKETAPHSLMNQKAWGWWWRESRIAQWRLTHLIHLQVKGMASTTCSHSMSLVNVSVFHLIYFSAWF